MFGHFQVTAKVPWQTHQLYYLTLYCHQSFWSTCLFDINFRFLVTKFTQLCLQCLSAKRLNVILKCDKLSHLLSTSNVLFTNLNVTCAMQGMLVTHLATYTSKLRKTQAQVHSLASTFVLNIPQHLKILIIILAFLRSVTANLTAWCLKCFLLLMNWDLVSMYN